MICLAYFQRTNPNKFNRVRYYESYKFKEYKDLLYFFAAFLTPKPRPADILKLLLVVPLLKTGL